MTISDDTPENQHFQAKNGCLVQMIFLFNRVIFIGSMLISGVYTSEMKVNGSLFGICQIILFYGKL